jgi:hypothetical protein
MDKNEITEMVIETFWKNKKYFLDIVNDGDFIGILSFIYNNSYSELVLEERAELMRKFVNGLVVCITLTFFPIVEDETLESKFKTYRQQLYDVIISTINDSGNTMIGALNIGELSTTIH